MACRSQPGKRNRTRKNKTSYYYSTNLLNELHPSTIVCPITSKVNSEILLLRVHLKKGQLDKPSDILIDQIRAIDNKRLIKRLSKLSRKQIQTLKTNIRVILDI